MKEPVMYKEDSHVQPGSAGFQPASKLPKILFQTTRNFVLTACLLIPFCNLADANAENPPPNRFEDDIRAFEKKDKISTPPAGGTVFVGSSTFTIWNDLEKIFSKYQAINRGFGGSTLPDINNYVERIVCKYKAKRVVVYAGTNDIAELKHTGEAVLADMKTFVKKVQGCLPDAQIYLVSMSMAPSRVQWEAQYIKGNSLLRDYAKTDPHLHFVDMVPVMRNQHGKLRTELFGPDSLHMNPKGYAVWAPVIDKSLSESKR